MRSSRGVIIALVASSTAVVFAFVIADAVLKASHTPSYPLADLRTHFLEILDDHTYMGFAITLLGLFGALEFAIHLANVASLSKLLTRALSRHIRAVATATGRRETVVDVMARVYGARSGRCSALLFAAVVVALGTAVVVGHRRAISFAIIVSVFYLLAALRQGILQFRINQGYFGTSEYEVRQLLRFVLHHDRSADFRDGGHPKPAFDIREDAFDRDVTATTPQVTS